MLLDCRSRVNLTDADPSSAMSIHCSAHPSSALSPLSTMASPTPTDSPSGQKPTSYTDAFRGREAHTKFADPCDQARIVSGSAPASHHSLRALTFLRARLTGEHEVPGQEQL